MIHSVLVTGGAGFIGSHVVDVLIAAGYRVRILDALLPPSHNGAVPSWLNPKAEFMQGNVCKKEDWQRALQGMDAVIHLAAYMDFHLDFHTYAETNIESLTWLFECIVEAKLPIQKIIAASSQSVYGEGRYLCFAHGIMECRPRSGAQLAEHRWEQFCPTCGATLLPVPEREGDALRPEIPYGTSKMAGEWLLKNFMDYAHIPTVSLRYSIVLGPRQSVKHFYSGALRAFAVYAMSGEPIQMNEDGGQLRDFVDVRDVAEAHRIVLEDARANGQAFNIGSGTGVRVRELAQLVAEEAAVPFRPLLQNRYRVGGARHSLMDIAKLRTLGWSPNRPLRASVRDYLASIKDPSSLNDVLKKTDESMRKDGLLKTL